MGTACTGELGYAIVELGAPLDRSERTIRTRNDVATRDNGFAFFVEACCTFYFEAVQGREIEAS